MNEVLVKEDYAVATEGKQDKPTDIDDATFEQKIS